jgi:hypothetical protein
VKFGKHPFGSAALETNGSKICFSRVLKMDSILHRAFVANGDLCSDVEFSSLHTISLDTPQIKEALATLSFDPHPKPGFR